MNAKRLAVLTVVSFAAAIYLLAIYAPGGDQNPLTHGLKANGQVLSKDAHQNPDGSVVYYVSYVFLDRQGINRLASHRVQDQALWDNLKENKDVKIFYLPEDPEDSLIAGETFPGSPVTVFLGWSLLLASILCGRLFYQALHRAELGAQAVVQAQETHVRRSA